MVKLWFNCVTLLLVALSVCALPQGHREDHHVHEEHNLDPTAIEEGMNQEHAKLIENLQRLKRTLDHVKERVGKGAYGETANVDMKNPEGAILTVLKSLQEQGQLFSMINDMLKAGSDVQNQTARIQAYSDLQEQVREEAAIAENTNHIAPLNHVAPPTPSQSVPTISSTTQRATDRRIKDEMKHPVKQHGYDDYVYQYRDDSKDATGDDHYDYHYDASGYDETPRTTTTTTTRRPTTARRVKSRGRNEYY